MAAKVGFAEGKCRECGRTLSRRHPADFAVCDCYLICPHCGKEMTAYTPDLDQHEYDAERGLDVVYLCLGHDPPYYSKRKPVEVNLS